MNFTIDEDNWRVCRIRKTLRKKRDAIISDYEQRDASRFDIIADLFIKKVKYKK